MLEEPVLLDVGELCRAQLPQPLQCPTKKVRIVSRAYAGADHVSQASSDGVRVCVLERNTQHGRLYPVKWCLKRGQSGKFWCNSLL